MLYQRIKWLQVFSCFTMDATKWAFLKKVWKPEQKAIQDRKYQTVILYAMKPARMC